MLFFTVSTIPVSLVLRTAHLSQMQGPSSGELLGQAGCLVDRTQGKDDGKTLTLIQDLDYRVDYYYKLAMIAEAKVNEQITSICLDRL